MSGRGRGEGGLCGKRGVDRYESDSDCEIIETKRVKFLDPILFVVSFDGDLHRRYGDHPALSGITGFHCENDMSFYTDEMHQKVVKSLPDFEGGTDNDDKLMALYEICPGEAIPGKSYRATVVFTYPL